MSKSHTIVACLVLIAPITVDAQKKAVTVTTKSGLQYRDLKPGTGRQVKKGDSVEVKYVCTLKNGRMVDDNDGRPYKIKVGAGEVVDGWDEGMVGMRMGGIRKLIVPAKLGFGSTASPGVPPNSVLVITLTLVSIK